MKKLIIGLLLLVCFNGWGQKDALEFTNRRAVADTVFGLLNPRLYGNALIDRSITEDSLLLKQLRKDYSGTANGLSWLQAYSDIAVSYTDPKYMFPDSVLIDKLKSANVRYVIKSKEDKLIQPFGLLLHQVSRIDSSLYDKKKKAFSNQRSQLKLNPNIKEENIYHKTVLKEAALLEIYGEHGYQTGTIVYDPDFISTGPNIKISSIELDLGSGFQPFGERNRTLTYSSDKDWKIGKAAVTYLLNNRKHRDTLSFYLTSKTYKYQSRVRSKHRFDNEHFTFPGNTPSNDNPLISWAVRYGCGNHKKIRRPVIIVPPYVPLIQTFLPAVSFEKYWDQFDYKSLMSYLSDMGYDVIFIKEVPGNRRLANSGNEVAKFIKYINQVKRQNYPNEDWENIVIGYSAGGQKLRYALKKLENEHMDGNGPAHHCRLYIPFDSPHWGANVPMFAQAVYYDFNASGNILAAIIYATLKDDASRSMLINHITGSYIEENGIDRIIYPAPDVIRQDFVDDLENSFNHLYTPLNDLRRSFPTFTRNVAVSVGHNSKDYEDEFGLTPGKKLFSQDAFIPDIFGPKIINRKIYSSKYATNAKVFSRKDYLLAGGFVPLWRRRVYKTKLAYEWDMAQGGYKDEFYDGLGTSPVSILRTSVFFSGFTPGQKHYKKGHMSFLPMVSALAINPSMWKPEVTGNNSLYYNLKNEGLMYKKATDIPNIKSNTYGYPNLGHPNNHFDITPFEAIYCDPITSEHIKMQKSAGNHVTKNEALVHLRDFILNEVEAKTVYFQNKDMGINHAPNDNNFTYTAWYKAEDEIIIGKDVTPKTDTGPYNIESTANITMYACNSITIKPDFYAKAGSKFHAFIKCDHCHGPVRPLYPTENNSMPPSTGTTIESFKNAPTINENQELRVYPNPSNETVNVLFPKNQGQYQLSNIQGEIIKEGGVIQDRNYIFQLSKGTYIIKWINNKGMQTQKIIIL